MKKKTKSESAHCMDKFDNKLGLHEINDLSENELKIKLIELMADQNDSQIQNDLLYDLVERYVRLSQELKKKIQEVEHLSNTDALTGLYNRLYFTKVFEENLKRYERFGHVFSVIMFDIDHFKRVNDNFGHNNGDMVLRSMSVLVKKIARKTDICARWGGEEFVILAEESNLEESQKLAERIRREIELFVFGEVGHITSSFGVAQLEAGDTLVALTGRADECLYEAKKTGRNKVCIYEK